MPKISCFRSFTGHFGSLNQVNSDLDMQDFASNKPFRVAHLELSSIGCVFSPFLRKVGSSIPGSNLPHGFSGGVGGLPIGLIGPNWVLGVSGCRCNEP